MGQSVSSVTASLSYSGPLSSVSTTTISSIATASATPFICPSYNNTAWTDYNGNQYEIACGSDFTAGILDIVSVMSFESCLEACDSTYTCSGVAYLGGNGAGTCYIRNGDGQFLYDNHTFGALRVAGAVSSVPITAAATSLASPTTFTLSTSVTDPFATLSPTIQPTSCPAANGTLLQDENYIYYNVYCSADTESASFTQTTVTGGFTACFDVCDVTAGCVGFTFVGNSDGTCYFKNTYGSPVFEPGNDFVVGLLQPNMTSSSAAISTSSSSSSSASSSLPPRISAMATSTTSSSPLISSSQVASLNNLFSSTVSIVSSSQVTTLGSLLSSSTIISSSQTSPSSPSISGAFPITTSASSVATLAAKTSMVVTSTPSSSAPSAMSSSSSTSGAASIATSSSLSYANSVSSAMASSFPTPIYKTTTSASSSVAYAVAPACPTSTDTICDSGSTSFTCSSDAGINYQTTCGTEYTGTVIDTSSIGGDRKRAAEPERATEPDYPSCIALCDTYPNCVGVNYAGDNCTLLSSITGTVPSTTNVGGVYTQSYSPSTTTTTTTASSSMPSSTVLSANTVSPTCPGSSGKEYTDFSGVQYKIACYTNFVGGDLGSLFTASSLASCLPQCDNTAGCIAVLWNMFNNTCNMKYSLAGVQISDTAIEYASRVGFGDPGLSSTAAASSTVSGVLSPSSFFSIAAMPPSTVTTCTYMNCPSRKTRN